MSMKEKIFYTAAAATAVYGVANTGYDLQQNITASNSLEATIDQQAAAEHAYKEENPEATQMPVDIQDSPAEYASLLQDRVEETRTDMKISLGIGVVGVVGLAVPIYVRLRRERKEAVQDLIDENKALHDKQEQDIEIVGEALSLLNSRKEFNEVRAEFAKNALSLQLAMAQSVEDLSNETGVPQENIRRAAEGIVQAIGILERQGAGDREIDYPSESSATESAEVAENSANAPAATPEAAEPQPTPQTTQASQPTTPQRAETQAPQAPSEPPRVHRASRRRRSDQQS